MHKRSQISIVQNLRSLSTDVLLINVNKYKAEKSLYEATRYAWVIKKSRANEAEVILSTWKGLIVGAFVADQWLEATAANFPGLAGEPDRLGFVGRNAPADMIKRYVGKRVPDEYRKPGAANPIRYTW